MAEIFKIAITRTRLEEVVEGHKWEQMRERSDCVEGQSIFGYTPEIISTKKVDREIYTQEVTELDLASVIKAINGINE